MFSRVTLNVISALEETDTDEERSTHEVRSGTSRVSVSGGENRDCTIVTESVELLPEVCRSVTPLDIVCQDRRIDLRKERRRKEHGRNKSIDRRWHVVCTESL